MEESELRGLAEDLRDALPGLIDDEAERATVAAGLDAALATPPGSGRAALTAALESHATTREWLRDRLPADTERAITIPGDPTAPLGTLFVCPQEDYDFVRERVNQQVPLCPVHKIALVRAEG
jgi:hypothetical protein